MNVPAWRAVVVLVWHKTGPESRCPQGELAKREKPTQLFFRIDARRRRSPGVPVEENGRWVVLAPLWERRESVPANLRDVSV